MLWRHRGSGAGYKTPDLLTYLCVRAAILTAQTVTEALWWC